MGNFHHRALMVCASVSAYTAPALMTVCLFTNYWIYGKQTRLSPNPIFRVGDTRILNFTYHRIGLWKECVRESVDVPYHCEIVRYSKTEAKSEKGFKAVSCKSILERETNPCLIVVCIFRSISTQYGLFHCCFSVANRCHFLIYTWSLQATSQSCFLHLRTSFLNLR
jgi:hypothetical protein